MMKKKGNHGNKAGKASRGQKPAQVSSATREYKHPVPSRDTISGFLATQKKAVSLETIMGHFELTRPEEAEGMLRRLRAMCRDGQAVQPDRGLYMELKDAVYCEGYVQAARDGFGFLIRDDGGDDIYIPKQQMRSVFNDDRVRVRVMPKAFRRRRVEGVIVSVLERRTHQIVGRYENDEGRAAVRCFNRHIGQPIALQSKPTFPLSEGAYVLAEIVEQPSMHKPAKAMITEVLGDHLTPGLEMQLAIFAYELPAQWPKKVMQQADGIPSQLHESDLGARCDWRDLPFVTIDGADAKDFDDAVYCEARDNGWRLYVAIADVSHYIEVGSPLDVEARERGNSVYFPSAVIPMLPERLSNGICSLCPKEDRLVFACVMDIDEAGEVVSAAFQDAVIHSKARLTYDQARDLHATSDHGTWPADVRFWHQPMQQLVACYHALRKHREARGAIDFDSTETKMRFDDAGKICGFAPLKRHMMHCLIEECMLAANVSAATTLLKAQQPVLYRDHESPDADRIMAVRDFLKSFGLQLSGKDAPTGKDYMALIDQIKDRPDAHLLQTVLLRSLKQAHFSPHNAGHFGLAYEQYCQFTSPIRRYPDLIVHRALRALSNKQKHPYPYDTAALEETGEHCSLTERRADRASRDALDWLKCHYMQPQVGSVFSGIISDVTSFGFFVELSDSYIEGLCHIAQLPNDYFISDLVRHRLVGKRSGRIFQLGDKVEVLLANVNLDLRRATTS